MNYVAVGMKTGDLCASAIPILSLKYSETGQKQRLVVAKQYAPILAGCSYIEPEIWTGAWDDLRGAFEEQRRKTDQITVISTHGDKWPINKKCPSFQLDQWLNAKMLSAFGKAPLVFDKRNPEREKKLVEKTLPVVQPFILFADHSNSSPFLHVDDLYQLIRDNFPSYKIIRLSEVKADFVFDLLGLYDRAACLVSVETMHLHLSAASKVPVIALATDRPEMWHGTAWQPRFALHVRYGDYDNRKPEIVRAIKDATEGRTLPQVTVTGVGGYNMSMMQVGKDRVASYRYHPQTEYWRTQLAFWDGEKTTRIIPPDRYKDFSLEDGRLFEHNGKLHISYTCARAPKNVHECVIQYGLLVKDGQQWKIVGAQQPRFKGNDFSGMQKNWSFFSHDGKLYAAIFRSPEQIVCEIHDDTIVREYRTKSPEWAWGQIRGGTAPIEHNGFWLQFFHSNFHERRAAYYMGALLMEKTPPFAIASISKFPVMAGNEEYFANWKYWKPRVMLPYGAVKDGDGFLVSVGINDSATGRVKLNIEHLNL